MINIIMVMSGWCIHNCVGNNIMNIENETFHFYDIFIYGCTERDHFDTF